MSIVQCLDKSYQALSTHLKNVPSLDALLNALMLRQLPAQNGVPAGDGCMEPNLSNCTVTFWGYLQEEDNEMHQSFTACWGKQETPHTSYREERRSKNVGVRLKDPSKPTAVAWCDIKAD